MLIYIYGILVTLFLGYFIKESKEIDYIGSPIHRRISIKSSGNQTFLKILCFLPLFLISAFRYGVGTDYFHTYYDGFIRLLHHSNYDNFEIGYKGLCLLLSQITEDPQIVFICTSFLFCFFCFKVIFRFSNDILFSLFLLIFTRYYFISLNVVRQFVGMAIVLYALHYLFGKEYFKYIFFVLVATSIHYSLILCVLFIFIDKIKINRLTFFVCTAGVLLFWLVFGTDFINKLVQKLLPFKKYLRHFANSFLYTGTKFAIGTFLLNFAILIIFFGVYRKYNHDLKYRFYLNIQLISTLICILMTILPLVERVYYIFAFAQILSIPYILNLYRNDGLKKVLKLGILIVFIGYCIYDIFVTGDHEVVPYQSIFSVTRYY
ncbi:MAG: EpsG family protein [Lachnospiraceae bacterium]|nr:EpsG family protein [Lachnospiraceae bacterium]